MSIPETIKKRKPTEFGTLEIRCFREENTTFIRFPLSGTDRKKDTGKNVGKITETECFIPNVNGLQLMKETRITPDVAPVVKNYGAYEMLRQLSPDIEE